MPLRIVARTNGVGIDRDVQILTEAFSSFRERPDFSHYRSISPLRGLIGRRPKDTSILFLERVTSRWLRRADHFLLIPNQERYPQRLVRLLRRMDHILCKSEHAKQIFAQHHPSVHYIGFTSLDRSLPEVPPDYERFLHLAGGSGLKGTAALLEAWARHPEWPELTLVQHSKAAPNEVPANVNLISRYLPDHELRELQNACGVHLCPSLSEGWGHYIVEAMSCGAVTLTTDGPPMNELIRPERGVLVPVERSEPRKLGINFHVAVAALEETIDRLIALPIAEKARIGATAREWFEANDGAFAERLRAIVSAVAPELVAEARGG
jgi:glycosyltransferase involved in cell wall biosynthesis